MATEANLPQTILLGVIQMATETFVKFRCGSAFARSLDLLVDDGGDHSLAGLLERLILAEARSRGRDMPSRIEAGVKRVHAERKTS